MIAYLDNSATTRPTEGVIEAMVRAMREGYFNPSSVYQPAVEAFRSVRACREAVLEKLGAVGEKLVFTSGGTEANNLAILGAVARMRGKQLVAVGRAEHPSVRAPFDRLRDMGHEVRALGVDSRGELDWGALEAALNDGASLVSCMQVNNETGAMLDCERLYRTVAGRALVHIDGVQGFLRVPFDMRNADMYTLSAHKVHGPKGVGALALRKTVRLEPAHIGGGRRRGCAPAPEHAGHRGAFAGGARDGRVGADGEEALHGPALPRSRSGGTRKRPGAGEGAPHILNMSFPNVRGETLLHALEAESVYASTGSACSSRKKRCRRCCSRWASHPTRRVRALRFSLSPHTELEEIDRAAEALREIYPKL